MRNLTLQFENVALNMGFCCTVHHIYLQTGQGNKSDECDFNGSGKLFSSLKLSLQTTFTSQFIITCGLAIFSSNALVCFLKLNLF